MELKRVIKAGKGLSVFITREAKKLGLKEGNYVLVSVRGNEIRMKKAKIS